MANIGSTKGHISFTVRRNQLQAANWQNGDLIFLYDPAEEIAGATGFVFISSSIIDSTTSLVNFKVISEQSFSNYFVMPSSFFRKGLSGSRVVVRGTDFSFLGEDPNVLNISAVNCFSSDSNASRHEIFNRNIDGSINSINPYNNFLENSIFSNIDKSWINADSRIQTSLGRHFPYNPLFLPITRRHLFAMGVSTTGTSSVKYIDPVSGSQSVIPISQIVNLRDAISDSGVGSLTGLADAVAGNISVIQLVSNIPATARRIRMCANLELFKQALNLPCYIITFTRKIGCMQGMISEVPYMAYSENLPIQSRLAGISGETDFVNFMFNGESGHALFAWDGTKSLFMGFTHNPSVISNLNFVNDSWNGVNSGFNSSGSSSVNFSDSQHVLTTLFDGYQIGIDSEKIMSILMSDAVWDSPVEGGGMLLESQVFELDNLISVPIFSNTNGARKKIIQKLRS